VPLDAARPDRFFFERRGIGDLAAGMEEREPRDGKARREAPMARTGSNVVAPLPTNEEALPGGSSAETDAGAMALAGSVAAQARSFATEAVARQAANGFSSRAGATDAFLAAGSFGAAPAHPTCSPDRSENGQEVDWAAQDWNDLIPRLYLVAIWRLRRLKGMVLRTGEAEDFVNDAVAKTIGGARIWNRENCTLFQHLAGVIVRDISHAVASLDSGLRVYDPSPSKNDNGWPPDLADESPSQELVEEWHSLQKRLLDYLKRIDPRMGRMAELILLEDINETKELCRQLALTPSKVANLRKRLKRTARAYYVGTWT
jgi:hypothetical protein